MGVAAAAAVSCAAQTNRGELRLTVVDQSGAPLQASGEITCPAAQVKLAFRTDTEGRFTAKPLAFCAYRVTVGSSGFGSFAGTVNVRSEVPVEQHVTLGVAPVETAVTVQEKPDLLDTTSTASPARINSTTVREQASAQRSRDVLNLVASQPGWLLEANGVLHPRGSEYETQYVVNGLPLTDNRSPAFAPGLESSEIGTMAILTAGYPAEYGRKLGGVIEVTSPSTSNPGWHGDASLNGGSFGSVDGAASIGHSGTKTSWGLSGAGGRTDRFLDPPVLDNFTNSATTSNATARLEQSFSDKDRLNLQLRYGQSGFEVPNELVQQQAGQRQDRSSEEWQGQASWQHVLSPDAVLNVRGMARSLDVGLRANDLSTPILPFQDRSLTEEYVQAIVSKHAGRHEWKFGADGLFGSLNERFSYLITDPGNFDAETPLSFNFRGRGQDREQAAFVQDTIRAGRLTISAGLRFDHYRLRMDESAWSPRIGFAFNLPELGLVLGGSYDRAFQTPASANLLLSSSADVLQLNDHVVGLPVPPSRGNFYQVGFSKSLWLRARLTTEFFLRDIANLADDDLLLNTGLSFPISFASARIHGVETRLELPTWGRLSGYLNWSNMSGVGRLPVTGGLLLDDEAAALLASTDRFPITQDQRNTAHGRLRFEVTKRIWLAAATSYGSGLPAEFDDPDIAELEEQYGQPILSRVNFARGRVRPSFSLDLSAGAEIWHHESVNMRLQADAFNLTDHLNLINFDGLFSGTAIAAPRSWALRWRAEF